MNVDYVITYNNNYYKHSTKSKGIATTRCSKHNKIEIYRLDKHRMEVEFTIL